FVQLFTRVRRRNKNTTFGRQSGISAGKSEIRTIWPQLPVASSNFEPPEFNFRFEFTSSGTVFATCRHLFKVGTVSRQLPDSSSDFKPILIDLWSQIHKSNRWTQLPL